jgi:hypothetical protein
VVWVLYRREFHSEVLAMLVDPPAPDAAPLAPAVAAAPQPAAAPVADAQP